MLQPSFPSDDFAAWFKEQLRLEKESTDKRSSLQGREDHRLLGAT
jgi:hypothetical protein